MKFLTKEQYDALPDWMKAQFKLSDDGENYEPTFVTEEEVAGLKRNNADLQEEKRLAQEKKDKADRAAAEAAEKEARARGDIDALEKSWKAKFKTLETDYAAKLQAATGRVHELTVGAAAKDLCVKLFGKRAGNRVLQKEIADRLSLEETEDGGYKVRVMQDGKPSALTLEDLEKEFRASDDYKPFIEGSGAAGGPSTPKPLTPGVTTTFGSNDNLRAAAAAAVAAVDSGE